MSPEVAALMTVYAEQWQKLLAPHRVTSTGTCCYELSDDRNPFLQDYDRIVFSSSFRRLAKKTQVHPLSRNDHIHNRLTHSLEVSCVGRSLGILAGQAVAGRGDMPQGFTPVHFGQIVQAACLAHDIGNPPFGHAGESAIQDWFKDEQNGGNYLKELREYEKTDFKTFDGNAQGFRLINRIENNKDRGGFRLTFPVIAALVKYPNSSYEAVGSDSKKFNYYAAEKNIFCQVFETLGLSCGGFRRHPLSYLLEAADDVCYRIIDMEDARELRIISYEDILDVLEPLKAALNIDEEKQKAMDSDRRRAGFLRAQLISHIVRSLGRTFEDKYAEIMEGRLEGSLLKHAESDVAAYLERAKRIFTEKILNNNQKISLEVGAYNLYRRLLDVFIPACFKVKMNRSLTYQEERALHLMGVNAPTHDDDLYQSYLRVLDFISGMTDDYATFISRQFSGTAG